MCNHVKKHLEWYHNAILILAVIYTLMNTTSVIINAYSCFNLDFHKSTSIYNISYNGQKLDDIPIPCK